MATRYRAPVGDISGDTSTTYARRLVTYISDPSTVRVRVLERFGFAPDIETIQEMRRQHMGWATSKKRPREEYRPARIIARAVKPAINFVPPKVGDAGGAVGEVIAVIAQSFGLTYADIIGPSRKSEVKSVRFLVAKILYDRGNNPRQIGRWIGGRDRDTIDNAIRKFADIAKGSPAIRKAYEHFKGEWVT